jgi:hypothetical protein
MKHSSIAKSLNFLAKGVNWRTQGVVRLIIDAVLSDHIGS